MSQVRLLPHLPRIGLSERDYRTFILEADRYRDHHSRAANKVGMYITRAIFRENTWHNKEKCFRHALQHHCHAPPEADDEVMSFYGALSHLVREHAGSEMLKEVSAKDDEYASRLSQGESRESVARDARAYFHSLIPNHHKPEWINLEDFQQVRLFEKQWTP